MSTILGSDISDRIVTVLGDYLPAELDLIDTQRGGDATADIGLFLEGPRPLMSTFPCINVDVKRWEFVDVQDSTTTTGRLEYRAHTEIGIHVQSTGQDTDVMRDLAERYLAGVARVLLVKRNGLETVANPVRWCLMVERDGDATVIDEEQGSGAMVRTVRLPLSIWMMESL